MSSKESKKEELDAIIKDLREMPPIRVHLEGTKNLNTIIEGVRHHFIGQSLGCCLDVLWNGSSDELIISQNSVRVGDDHFNMYVRTHQEEIEEWLQRRNKSSDLKTFVQLKLETVRLRAEVEELRSELGKRNRDEGPGIMQFGPMMHPLFRRW